MNELTTWMAQLPDTIDEVADFVVVNEEKLNAVRAAIRLARKANDINLAELEKQQRELEKTTVLAQCKLGELTAGMAKATNQYARPSLGHAPKEEQLANIGVTRQRANEYEKMAAHPDIVLRVMESGEHVTKSAILREINEERKPHVSFNSGNNEWYTPSEIIEAARLAMGSIDLDPASSEIAQKIVRAGEYYTAETNGLEHEWHGNVFMNPPYASDMIGRFISKLLEEYGHYQQAVVLVNNATETEWFNDLISIASAVCFPKSRVKFYMPDGKTGAPLQGQAVVYIGKDWEDFIGAFSEIGWGAVLIGV